MQKVLKMYYLIDSLEKELISIKPEKLDDINTAGMLIKLLTITKQARKHFDVLFKESATDMGTVSDMIDEAIEDFLKKLPAL